MPFSQKGYQNHNGFSLVEMMVVIVIMSIVGMAISSLMVGTLRMTTNARVTSNITDTMVLLRLAMNSASTCTMNLSEDPNVDDVGMPDPPVATIANVDHIKLSDGSMVIQINQPINGVPGTKVTGLWLTDFHKVTTDTTGKSFTAKLQVVVNKGGEVAGAQTSDKNFLTLALGIETDGKIFACTDASVKEFCDDIGGSFSMNPDPGKTRCQGFIKYQD